MTDPVTTFTDEELVRAERRAWVSAARLWLNYRATLDHTQDKNTQALLESAKSAEATWQAFADERTRRRHQEAAPPFNPLSPSHQEF